MSPRIIDVLNGKAQSDVLQPKRYRCVMADPPWSRSDANGPVKPRTAHGDPERFDTMRIGDIRALPVQSVLAKQAHLWLWTMNGTMEQAMSVVRAWGFAPMTIVTWCKRGGFMGRRQYFRTTSEQLIFATRGTPAMLPEKPMEGTWFTWPKSTWAVKPDEQYELIEAVSPGPRLELFARRTRDGWDGWGNQLDGGVDLGWEAASIPRVMS